MQGGGTYPASEQHPFHIHVNDFLVVSATSSITKTTG